MKVDGIEVSIESSAAKANAELDKLISKLGRVSDAIMSTNKGGSFTNMANGVQKLGNAMQSVSNVGLPAFNRLAKGIDRISTVDTASMQRTASAITQMSKSFNSIGAVSQNAQQMGDLAKNLAKFGYKSTTSAIDNIPKLADSLKQLMVTLSNAPTVSQNLIQMTNALANLASHGKAAGSASKVLSSGLNTFSVSANRAHKRTTSLAAAFGKFYATYWLLIRAGQKFKQAIDISSDLTEVQNVVDTTFGKYSALIEKMTETSIQDFGMSELTTKQISSRFQAMGSAMGFAQGSMANMSISLTKLAADMASFYNVEQTDVAEDLESVFTGQTRPLRTYGLDLTEATLKEWAMKQGMDADIESMGQMEKMLLRYQYVLSNTTAAQGDFARTANTWANQVRILKQSFEQLASIVGGALINAFKPLVSTLNVVLQKVILFAEKVTEALGTIFGWQYESNAAGLAVDFDDIEDSTGGVADNLGEAAKNAKKLTTFAYDELNKRSDSDSGSSSSGSSTGTSSTDGGLKQAKTIFDGYKSQIDNLYKLGESIGKTLTDAMNGIDWEEVYKGARNFGTGLADFLNGLISPELFGATGRTIAGALNTAIYAALSFGQTFDWKNLGESIAEGINEFFGTFDAKALAETINVWVQGIYTTVKTTIEDIEWKDVWDKAIEFISNIDIETVEILIGAFAINYTGKSLKTILAAWVTKSLGGFSISKFITGLMGGFTGLSGVATAITTVLSSMNPAMLGELSLQFERWAKGTIFDPMSWKGVGGDIVRAINGALNDIVDGGAKLISVWVGKIFSWENTKAVFEDAKKNFKKGGLNIVLGIGEGILGALGFLVEPIASIFTGLWDGLCAVFGIHSPAEKMKPLGMNILLGVVEGFKGAFGSFAIAISGFFTEYVAPWFTFNKWLEMYGNIKTSLAAKWGEVVEWWKNSGAYKWYEDNVKPLFEEKKWSFAGIKDGLFSIFNSAIEAVKGLWNKFATWLNDKLTFNLDTSTVIGKGISNLLGTSTIKLVNLPTFATGGFPEDGLFRANRNELVGRFSNGNTAVVNNTQIIAGVEGGVERGMTNALMNVAMATNSGTDDNREIHIHVHLAGSDAELGTAVYKSMQTASRQGLIPKFI